MATKTIIVDFDGALRDPKTEKPVDAMVKRIRQWLSEDYRVFVLAANTDACDEWLDAHVLGDESITSIHRTPVVFDEFWSSRVVQLEPNTGRRLVPVKGYGAGAQG